MLVHLNGQLVEHDRAAVSPFDRGFLFGDALYEGLRSFHDERAGRARVIGLRRHIARMAAGLREARIAWDAKQLGPLTDQLLAANGLHEAFIYWQVSRGTPRLGAGPVRARVPADIERPTVFGYCTPLPPMSDRPALKRASLQPDVRWLRGTLKTTSLIGNIMAASAAHAGCAADEAILVRRVGEHDVVTEGTYTNVALALPDAASLGPVPGLRLVTPALTSAPLLAGVTRDILLSCGCGLSEARVTRADLDRASEVLLIGTTTMVTTVTHIDGRPTRMPEPGPAAIHLLAALLRAIHSGREDVVTD